MRDLIFQPMGVLAALTFFVLFIIPIVRVVATRAGRTKPSDYKLGESLNVPADVAVSNRNYMNLLELPTLFYPICLMFYVADKVDQTTLNLAWAYVALRGVHTLIHLTYHNVLHRMIMFGLSTFMLVSLWVRFFVG